MLTRRSFFKNVGSFVVGCYLAAGLKPLEKLTIIKNEPRLEVNPEWMKAPYEVCFIYEAKEFVPIIFDRDYPGLPPKTIHDSVPIRFNKDGDVVKPYREYKI